MPEEHVIISEGITIGFFQEKIDAQKAMRYVSSGYINSMTKTMSELI